ncbi:MAG TPA: carboxypeptidase regulatory-like domain-containing protein [Solibacterales bacterium]|nr:carboxypeptidase regulatory-like domain-containing protein [Bryobacterales bacterium]
MRSFRTLNLLALMLCLALLTGTASAQSIYATLTGVVSDQSNAVVPNANVVIKNMASGDTRRTVTNSEGYFTFASLTVATYEVSVEASGFMPYKVAGIAFTGADRRNLDIVLKVGTTSEQVEVTSVADVLTPVDSGEKAAVLTTKQLQDFSVVGRSAAEFIKILPGFAISGTGTENRTNFNGEVIGINGNGDGGSQSAMNNAFSVNGQASGQSLDITADGSHVSDPGCNCATPVNPNTDMIQEFKVQTANFGAENAKGPAVISSISKAGGRDFHGSAYLYARHNTLNSNDWLNNRFGQPRPANKFFFPGGNIGGPVLIPGTNFNRNRDKLFFFTGYEHYFQTLDTGLLRTTTATEGMRGGNFSPAELAKLGNVTASGGPPSQINSDQFPNGIVPASQIDRTGRGLMNLYPLPNANPNANGGFNYVRQINFNQNSLQWLSRVDYNISDNTKLFVRYNLQAETQRFPVGLWWRNPPQVPYPTEILGKNRSHSISASLTHVFSPTLTNEFVFGYTFIGFPNVFDDPDKVNRTNLGIPFRGLWKNGVTQIPSMTAWGGEFASLFNPGGFEAGGSRGLFADKYLPTFSNNVSKVLATHTLKFGGFFEYIINNQPGNGYTNGLAVQSNWGGNTSGNPWSDLLLGRVTQYQEQDFNRLNNIGSAILEFFAQDSWKATRRLTLELGMRVSHYGPWVDRLGFGQATFDASRYNPNAPANEYSGFLWNKRDPNVPIGGFETRPLFFAPRFGMALDVFGNGKTVLRGGWGRFIFQTPQFTAGLDVAAGVRSYNIQNATTFAAIDALNQNTVDRLGVSAVLRSDDRRPRTDSYSFTLSQRMPFSSLLEVSYVGNMGRHLLNGSGNGAAANIANNINFIPAGSLFRLPNPNDGDIDQFRPLRGLQDVRLSQFTAYSNYNSMQVSWLRTKGRYNINMNYTWGKAMGIVGNWDDTNLDQNYGVLGSDRRHVFNAAYSIELPNIVRPGTNKFASGVLNGWQFSGITQIQSGVNLTANTGGSFNLDTGGAQLASGLNVTDRSINGTTAIALRPVVTCDLGSNLASRQFVNGNCLALPSARGVNGPTVLPPVYGPAFFVSDLGLYKNFNFSESKRLQFRFNAYNFLNHPLDSFINGGTNLRLIFNNQGRMVNPIFGSITERQGRRIVQLALKYQF